MHRILVCVSLLVPALAFGAPLFPQPVLPQAFAGWTQTAAPSTTSDPADATVLKEYGLTRYEAASYSSGTNHVAVRAWRFTDATGAYGAFTLYRQPPMHPETIGQGAAATDDHFLVWTGATVVDATFAGSVRDEKAAVTALTDQIPPPAGAERVPPSLPRYLPSSQLDATSVRYAIGPAAYARMGGALAAGAIDFSQDAEVILARYGQPGQQGTLTLIMYPTPQIAGAHLKTIDALAQSSGMATKRSGPLVAVVSGYPHDKAQVLLNQIRFSDYVTINHPEGYVSEAAKLSRLLLGIATLTGILLGAALLLGIFLGGGRAMVRVLRGKPVSILSEEEFISLHLEVETLGERPSR